MSDIFKHQERQSQPCLGNIFLLKLLLEGVIVGKEALNSPKLRAGAAAVMDSSLLCFNGFGKMLVEFSLRFLRICLVFIGP